MAALLILLGYACGMFPTGLLLTRGRGIDIRTLGSGNVGATNVARHAGLRTGLLTLLGDVLKGAAPALVAGRATGDPAWASWAGLAAVVGHTHPLISGLAGGKGVATGLGAMAAGQPAVAALACLVFLITLGATRYVSAASLVAATSAPFAAIALGAGAASVTATAGITVVVALRHRENVRRLLAGDEPRIVLHKRQATHED